MTTNIEKLNQLYAATRLAPLTADQHDAVRQLAYELAEALEPKPAADGEAKQS
jgi:hypothetical protein